MTKATFSVVGFLRSAITSSIERLMKSVVDTIDDAKKCEGVLVVKTKAVITVMQRMKMGEALDLFSTFLVCSLGEKGIEVPADIQKMFAPVAEKLVAPQVTLAPTPAPKPVVVAAPAPKPVPKPAAIIAPARNLDKPFNPDNAKKTWLGQLGGIARGGRAPWPVVQSTAVKLFHSGIQLSTEEWQLLFSAMKKASENGGFILNCGAVESPAFGKVPTALLDDFVFGQDGAMISIMASLSEIHDGGQMEPWHVAKTHVVLAMVDVLDRSSEDGLSEHELDGVERLEKLLQKLAAPLALFERISSILSGSEPGLHRDSNWQGDGRMASALQEAIQ